MNSRAGEAAATGAGLAYLMYLGWAIANVSYDVWGALIVIPIYGLIGAAIVMRVFRGSQHLVATAMMWGLLVKLGGAFGRYWVGFGANDGGIDAGRYHAVAAQAVSKVWSGETSWTTALPRGQGTAFLDHLTTFIYLLTGSSQLAAFVTFSFMAYVGTVLMVKAAVIAIPSLAAKRYAWMCVLFPSVVYWPSSIGKEAPVLLGLGVATLGIAILLTYGRWISSVVLIAAGLGFTSLIRPHMAGIWIAAALPALVVSLSRRSSGAQRGAERGRTVNRVGIVITLVFASIGLAVIASVTVRYLQPNSDETTTDSLTQILERTATRTSEGNSNFTPISVNSPANWPYAVVRTLTRPLPYEARTVAQIVSAAEMAVLIGVYVAARRRLYNLPRMLVSSPYVTFAVTALFLAGLAYSSFANLGILTRQKSLLIPLLVLLPCLPERQWQRSTPGLSSDSRWTPPSVAPEPMLNASNGPSSNADRIAATVANVPASAISLPTANVCTELDDLWA